MHTASQSERATIMAHNLFGERFFSFRRPAWHGLGQVLDQEMNAAQAFDLIGAYDVYTEPMTTASGLPVPTKAVVRAPVNGEDKPTVLSVVSNDYELVTPRQVVNAWDSAVTRPVETIGALGKGETLFISTKLPTLDVNGDEIENYLLAASPMTGNDAIWIRVTPVRVVCQNTLIASASDSTEKHRVIHDRRAEDRLKQWLEHVYTKAVAKAETMNRAFRAMAATPVTKEDQSNVLEMVYTMPAMPRRLEMPQEVYIERAAKHEYDVRRMQDKRAATLELFEGRGLGSTSSAARGTAWGLYNAVVELEDYSGRQTTATKESAIVGDRARTKATAYEACLELVRR
jgi:phage/plasmid-like protein (TIGR03299 family)